MIRHTELTLSITLRSGSESALLRALTVLHRRRCRVLEARYGTAGAADRLRLRVQAPSRHAHCVQAWLSSLVDVDAVTAYGATASTSARSARSGAIGGSSAERTMPA
jgi:acetolactate synthase regulatory subunit